MQSVMLNVTRTSVAATFSHTTSDKEKKIDVWSQLTIVVDETSYFLNGSFCSFLKICDVKKMFCQICKFFKEKKLN